MTFSYCECGRSSVVAILVCVRYLHISQGTPVRSRGTPRCSWPVHLKHSIRRAASTSLQCTPIRRAASISLQYTPIRQFIPHSLCCEYQPTIYSHSSCCVYQPTMYSQLKRQNGSVASTNLQCTPYRRAASTSLQCTPNQRNLSHPGAPIAMK